MAKQRRANARDWWSWAAAAWAGRGQNPPGALFVLGCGRGGPGHPCCLTIWVHQDVIVIFNLWVATVDPEVAVTLAL